MLSLGKNIGYQWVERQNGWGKNDWKKEHVGVVGLFSPLHVRNRTTDSKISCFLLPARLYLPIPCLPTWKRTDPEWELALNFIPCICYPSYICTLFSLSLICNGSTWIPCVYRSTYTALHCTTPVRTNIGMCEDTKHHITPTRGRSSSCFRHIWWGHSTVVQYHDLTVYLHQIRNSGWGWGRLLLEWIVRLLTPTGEDKLG